MGLRKRVPREGDSPNREMDVARVSDKALRKTDELETTTGRSCDEDWTPCGRCCARPIIGEETRTHCGSRQMKDQNAPRWMIWISVSMRYNRGCVNINDDRKSDGTVGARCLARLDEQGQHAQKCLIGGDRALLRRLAGNKRAITKAAGRDGDYRSGENSEPCTGQIHGCDNPLGHRA